MKIDVAFYDDDIAFEHVLTLFRRGKFPHVEATLSHREDRLRYHLRGEVDESVLFEQESLLELVLRCGRQWPDVEVALSQEHDQLMYRFEGKIGVAVVVEQALRAAPIEKLKRKGPDFSVS
jgi:hypothetical protein